MAMLTEKILEYLQLQAESTVDLLDIMTSDRSSAMRKAHRSMIQGPPEFKTDWVEWYRKRQRFHSLLNKLKRDGLIAKRKQERGSEWHITKTGTDYLRRRKTSQSLPKLEKGKYIKKESAGLIIVTFDIPEHDRRKRRWLRMELTTLDFKMLQQSVWLGKTKIPEDFIKALRKYEVVSYVHIFSVGKSGTIVEKF